MRATTWVLLLICLMYGITYIDRVNIATAAGSIKKEFGFSNQQYGLIFAAFGWAYLALQITGGWIADRFGARKTLTISGLIWAGATLLMGLVSGFWSLYVCRMLLGVGEGATFPTATRAMSNWTEPDKRGFAQGITHTFARVGNALAPILVVTLMGSFGGWRGSFVALGLVSLIWIAVWVFYFRNDPREHKSITPEELTVLPKFRGRAELKTEPIPWGPLARRMVPVVIVYFCYGWSLWLYLSWVPSFFNSGFKVNLKTTALISMCVFLAGGLGNTVGGLVSDRILQVKKSLLWARSYLVCFSMICSLCCLLPVVLVHNSLTVSAVLLGVAFFFLEMSIGPMWAIPMDIAPQFSGTASGIMNSGSALAAIVSPWIFGLVVDKTGSWTLPFAGSIVLLLSGAILSFTMHPERSLALGTAAALPAAPERASTI
ncbi:MAG TPA: MFS transporter [Myxococcales bacterium]|nr:MFS transporter [Myxococcales bacterium]